MQGSRLANRYAKSLLGLAIEQKQLEEVYGDMQYVIDTCKNRDLVSLLNSPIINADKKINILNAIFSPLLKTKLASEYVKIIVTKKRENYLPFIAQEFVRLYKRYKNVHTATVTTAVKLDQTLRDRIMNIVKEHVKGDVELIERLDKEVIGGFVLSFEDKQIDQSIGRSLSDLKRKMTDTSFIKDY